MEKWFITCTFTGLITLQFFVILYLVFILHRRHISERNHYREQVGEFFNKCISLLAKDYNNSSPRLMTRSDEDETRIEELRKIL